jgi:crotonobetainyl-CoA:carnitine CoA-transferase CaiB-like acyl-CoA transferase
MTALSGIRALVVTQAWAGTFATELLAMAGAEVIQVEARQRPDGWRMGYDGPVPDALKDVPTAQNRWNVSGFYNSVNLNKFGITLDLKSEQGLDLFRRLVPHADIVADNFSPGVMDRLGLGYEDLCKIRPDIILCSMSAYGASGPYETFIGNGGTMEPSSGMSSLLGYVDGQPLNSGAMYPDPVQGYNGFAAMTTALLHRLRTGKGQFLDVSMMEANHSLIGDATLEYALTGEVRPRQGNRHFTFSPHGVYPARGENRWVAIAAENEQQWAALCAQSGLNWATDPRFATNAGRREHEAALDTAIAAWTQDQDRDELAARLAQAGVIAAPVQDAMEVSVDPSFTERGLVTEVDHPEAGRWKQMSVPYQFSLTPERVTGPSPRLGEHSREVLQRLLGISDQEYEELEAQGVTGMGPPD